MINLSQEAIFNDNLKTLHDTSYDKDNNQYMTNSTFPAIDFDDVKTSYILSNSTLSAAGMRSNDALVILNSQNGKFLFIEFKNGIISGSKSKLKLEQEKIRSKIGESLLILNDIIKEDLTFDRNNINYILVYNESKNPDFQTQRNNSFSGIGAILGSYAKMTFLIDGFDRYNIFFHNVKTINEKEFAVIANQLQTNAYIF